MDSLPDIGDAHGIYKFAMKFNGYEHHGSFEACANAAKEKKRSTKADCLNELFFWARASRHDSGLIEDAKFVQVYSELKPVLERLDS